MVQGGMGTIFNPAEKMLGGYQPHDGTVEFYGRIRAVLKPDHVVVDVGAGRAAWFHDDKSQVRRELRDIRPHVARLIGVDVDPAVMGNPATTENIVMTGDAIPLTSGSADVVIADYVLEHILAPEAFVAEIDRILKPGGYFFARTPNRFEYVTLAARLIRNGSHSKILQRVQPGARKAVDVFPTAYRMNSRSTISRLFHGYANYSYLYSAEPSYYFGRKWLFWLMSAAHRYLPRALVSNIFVALRKPV